MAPRHTVAASVGGGGWWRATAFGEERACSRAEHLQRTTHTGEPPTQPYIQLTTQYKVPPSPTDWGERGPTARLTIVTVFGKCRGWPTISTSFQNCPQPVAFSTYLQTRPRIKFGLFNIKKIKWQNSIRWSQTEKEQIEAVVWGERAERVIYFKTEEESWSGGCNGNRVQDVDIWLKSGGGWFFF